MSCNIITSLHLTVSGIDFCLLRYLTKLLVLKSDDLLHWRVDVKFTYIVKISYSSSLFAWPDVHFPGLSRWPKWPNWNFVIQIIYTEKLVQFSDLGTPLEVKSTLLKRAKLFLPPEGLPVNSIRALYFVKKNALLLNSSCQALS